MDAPTGGLFVPVGTSPFVTYEGLPSDEYLWLLGQGTKMLREELPFTLTKGLPGRKGRFRVCI